MSTSDNNPSLNSSTQYEEVSANVPVPKKKQSKMSFCSYFLLIFFFVTFLTGVFTCTMAIKNVRSATEQAYNQTHNLREKKTTQSEP